MASIPTESALLNAAIVTPGVSECSASSWPKTSWRLAASRLHQEDAVRILFNEIAPAQKERPGGYTRILKLGPRQGDNAPMARIELV